MTDLWEEIIKSMEERRQLGIERYGRPVFPFNDRSHAFLYTGYVRKGVE